MKRESTCRFNKVNFFLNIYLIKTAKEKEVTNLLTTFIYLFKEVYPLIDKKGVKTIVDVEKFKTSKTLELCKHIS